MAPDSQPKESDLEHVISLDQDDVAAIDAAILALLTEHWRPSSEVVDAATDYLRGQFPTVPAVFYSYRLRALVADQRAHSDRPVTRELTYLVRAVVA